MNKVLLTSGEVQKLLGISNPTLQKYYREGLLVPAHFTRGGHHRYSAKTVQEFITKFSK